MKKERSSRSAYINFRVLLAFTLCLAGLSLGVTAFGAWPGLTTAAWVGSHYQTARDAKINVKNRKGGGAAKSTIPVRSTSVKSVKSNTGSIAQTQADNSTPNTVSQQTNALGQTVYSISPSRFDLSPPLIELAALSLPEPPELQLPEPKLPPWRILRSDRPDPVTQVAPASRDSVSFPGAPPAPAVPATGFNFEGIPGANSFPPDTNGSVGNNQYVETVNTRYQVWSLNRTTNTATPVFPVPPNINTLWAGFGGACQTQNAGDPIVLYDKVANRWLISQFTSAPDAGGDFYQCVAISTTASATGTYHRYAFAVPNDDFGDYPHYGVWTDAYYVMAHNFEPDGSGGFSFVAACFGAMDRTKMLAGDPSATWQVILDPLEGGHMPADLDGFAPPPGGAPGIFTSLHGDGMYLYRMKVDFTTPANTTNTLQAIMPIAPAAAACGGGNCIPQPQSPFTIDSLADRLMFRLAYRNLIDHESLVVSHSVDPGIPGVVSGVRWYDFRISGQPDAVCSSYPCTYQQGTVADVPNGRSRWMPSISMDGAENILVGYSATGMIEATDAHSIRYTSRAKGDPLGTMTGPETIIFTGTRNIVNEPNVSPARWGDYTSTSIDPFDDCTFWHANEYYALGGVDNSDWHTRIASSRFPAGTDFGQCQPTTCTIRPTSAPTNVTASVPGNNQIMVSWTGITPTPGSYAIERAVGAVGSEGLYQPLAFVPGSSSSFIDTTVQGGVTYAYRVIAATDAGGRCQALVRSGGASATATGSCNLEPIFAGVTGATSLDGPVCGITVSWSPGSTSCPFRQLRYNIYRGTVPDFVPSVANRIASCVPGPNSYLDTDNLTSGTTYHYVVRAEDDTTGGSGACGGNEESNNVHIAGTAYGPGTQSTPSTWTDGGGDATSFLRLNPTGTGNTADPAWRIVRTADDPGANHTAGGAYAYRNAGPGANATYSSSVCASAETPVLTAGATSLNLTYWERHQMEKGWDGVAIEYSLNGGAWTDVPAPSSLPTDGCMVTDVTLDYATLGCTGTPPINACGYPDTKPVITGPPTAPDPGCAVPTGALTAYGRRCHLLTGLAVGDTIQFRWRSTSDPGLEFAGFYLDDIAVTNIRLPNSCAPGGASTPTPGPTVTPSPSATPSPSPSASPTPAPTPTPTPLPTATPPPCTPGGSFSDDFEPAAEPGWVVNTDINLVPTSLPWTVLGDPTAHSATNSYKTDASTVDEKDDRLTAPPQDLSSTSHVIFWHRFNTEATFDGGVLEVSNNGGTTWVDVLDGGGVFVVGGYNDVIDPGFNSRIAGRPAWTGLSEFANAMNMVDVNLGAFAGPSRLIRWRYVGDPFVPGSIAGESWAIDDVQFTNTCAGSTPTPTATATIAPTATPSATATIVPTATPTATATATIVPTATPTATATATVIPTATPTATATATVIPTATPTATATATIVPTATPTATATATIVPTATPTATATATIVPTATPTATATATIVPTATPTATATATIVPTATPTATATATIVPTATPTATATATIVPTATPTATATATIVPTATPTATATATIVPTATPTATATIAPTATPTASPTPSPIQPAQTVNLSTRMFVQTGDNVGIGGFIVTGTGPKSVLLRAIGPSLSSSVPNALSDTVLELHGPAGFATIVNDNWRDTQETEIEATGIPPTNNLESAILASLNPGNYTGIVRGNGNATGVALVEVYDLDVAAASKLANISTRAFVQTGDDIVIAGFILGNGAGVDNVVVRGIGPSLSQAGVPNVLANPTLELRDNNGALVRANNDWQEDPVQAAIISSIGLAPGNVLESAIAATLVPGPYTALLAGLSNETGNGLVEVYDLASSAPFATPTPGGASPTPTPATPTPTPPPATPTPTPSGPCLEDFDASSSLPAGWVATNDQGPPPLWAISTTSSDTAPNNAFVSDTAVISDKRMESRPISIFSAAAQISFRNNYDFEFSDGTYWDGGVMEVSINSGPFVDVTHPSVGGVFVSGAYNGTIDSTADNPISSQPAWASSSGGYINSVINLGAALQGQTIVVRFRMGTDQAIGAPGWHVDTFVVTGGSCSP